MLNLQRKKFDWGGAMSPAGDIAEKKVSQLHTTCRRLDFAQRLCKGQLNNKIINTHFESPLIKTQAREI